MTRFKFGSSGFESDLLTNFAQQQPFQTYSCLDRKYSSSVYWNLLTYFQNNHYCSLPSNTLYFLQINAYNTPRAVFETFAKAFLF